VEHAGFFYDLALARAEKATMSFGPAAMVTFGPRDLLAGRLAHLDGRAEVAVDHLRRSLSFCERLGSPPLIAQSSLALAEALATRGDAEARSHAARARKTALSVGMQAVAARAETLAGGVPPAVPLAATPAPGATPSLSIQRRGELWALSAGGREIALKDARGLGYLEALVATPHREVHVLDLLGADVEGDGGPVLDEKAKRAYRERAEALRESLEEATRFSDAGRAEKARAELEALADEVSRAVGLGGRDRRVASVTERARINVQRRLRDVIRRAGAADAFIGRHLELSVKTGVFCLYAPTWPDAER
jgi:hypothetical protein